MGHVFGILRSERRPCSPTVRRPTKGSPLSHWPEHGVPMCPDGFVPTRRIESLNDPRLDTGLRRVLSLKPSIGQLSESPSCSHRPRQAWLTSALPMINAFATSLKSLEAAINMAVCPFLRLITRAHLTPTRFSTNGA